MKKIIIKILFIFSIFALQSKMFCADIQLNCSYGINNTARSGRLIPIELELRNRAVESFDGYILVKVYENNDSIFQYRYNDISINSNANYSKNIYVSVSDNSNTIIVDVYEEDGKLAVSQRLNVDLFSLDNKLIIGVISNDYSRLDYFDDVSLRNGNIKTRTIPITNEDFEKNRKIFDQIDCLLISNIFATEISEAINSALINFINEGKVIILGTGKNAGFNIPMPFLKYQNGPAIEISKSINFNGKWTDNNPIYIYKSIPINLYSFNDNTSLIDDEGFSYINNLYIGNGVLCNASFDFCDIDSLMKSNKIYIEKMLEEVVGKKRLDDIENVNVNLKTNNYESLRELVNVSEDNIYPSIIPLTLLLLIYITILTIIIYAVLKNRHLLNYYEKVVCIASLIFVIIITLIVRSTMRNGTFLTYSSIVELYTGSSLEKTYLQFRTSENSSYEFRTSANNELYPILKRNNEIIKIDENYKNKITEFLIEGNNKIINTSNNKQFDDTLFIYENANDLNSDYPIDISLNYFDGEVSGRITNRLDSDIEDASITLYGKVIFVGELESGRSLMINKLKTYNAPIYNSIMQSELMAYYPNNKLIKHYLDSINNTNVESVKFFGFINKNKTIDINSNDINSISGKTLIVKDIKASFTNENMKDIVSTNYNVENISGLYEQSTNTILGNADVINSYKFDSKLILNKIYFENLTTYDTGKEEYNVAFYGNIYAKNLFTGNYDMIVYNELQSDELKLYLTEDNMITLKFISSGEDILKRKISLPLIRAIGEINDSIY